jgi:3-dehydroquinate synthase
MKHEYTFTLNEVKSHVCIQHELPSINTLLIDASVDAHRVLLVCDAHTEPLARSMLGAAVGAASDSALCVLPPGETAKSWASVEAVLRAARDAGLGRDGLFVGIGGGVISDLTAFAASIYMRGARVALVSTTLLGMVDAAVGGKTGFDLFDIKNLVGSFYPAERIYMPVASLATLSDREWKSGMAEVIKTALLDSPASRAAGSRAPDEQGDFLALLASLDAPLGARLLETRADAVVECICRSVSIKGRIVESDPKETGSERIALNLGHSFAHALESSVGLGRVSHGEAVAWGVARACELGEALGVTPVARSAGIRELLRRFGYEIAAPHPFVSDTAAFMRALSGDKKKKAGALMFVIPAARGIALVSGSDFEAPLLERVIKGIN